MRNILKATTLENKFPLLAVEHGCIISKDADLTVAFEVELPELYTVTGAEYEAIHSCWIKAIKVLPDYSIVHKQDWYIRETYWFFAISPFPISATSSSYSILLSLFACLRQINKQVIATIVISVAPIDTNISSIIFILFFELHISIEEKRVH